MKLLSKLETIIPARMRGLPIDERGYCVPKFVAWLDGKPDFRVIAPGWLTRAVHNDLCWLCGGKLGRWKAFVIGPMCAINRVNSEPPSHLDCAQFAVRACPFLTQPRRMRNEHDLPEDGEKAPGMALDRNPGVALIWVTKSYRMFKAPGGYLFALGSPVALEWYAHGREATRDEVMASIETGLPLLRKAAEEQGPDAVRAFEAQAERGLALVPT